MVVAELPGDPNQDGLSAEEKEQLQKLNDIVLTNMIHGPCRAPMCLDKDNICSKKFPKDYVEKTYFDPHHQPIYRRRSPNGL